VLRQNRYLSLRLGSTCILYRVYRVYPVFRVNKVSEDLNFIFESTCKVVLFGKIPAAIKPEKHDKPDKHDPINRIKRTRGVRTLRGTRSPSAADSNR